MAECIDCRKEGKGGVVAHYIKPDLCFDHKRIRHGDFTEEEKKQLQDTRLEVGSSVVLPATITQQHPFNLIQDLGYENIPPIGWVLKGRCATPDCLEVRHRSDCTGFCRKCKIEKEIIRVPKQESIARAHTVIISPGHNRTTYDVVSNQPANSKGLIIEEEDRETYLKQNSGRIVEAKYSLICKQLVALSENKILKVSDPEEKNLVKLKNKLKANINRYLKQSGDKDFIMKLRINKQRGHVVIWKLIKKVTIDV